MKMNIFVHYTNFQNLKYSQSRFYKYYIIYLFHLFPTIL